MTVSKPSWRGCAQRVSGSDGAQRGSAIVKLRSSAGTGYTYVTRKNRRNDPDRLRLKKYDPVVRQHVEFREER